MSHPHSFNSDSCATECLRTAETCFENVPYFLYSPRFNASLPSFGAMQMAHIDEAPTTLANDRVALCLHGEPSWSFLYRKMIEPLRAAGYRVVAPDLFGFGRSDKPIDPGWYTFNTHRRSLIEFIEQLDLNNITLIVQDWGGLLGLTLPHEMPARFKQLIVMNTTLGTGNVALSDGFKAWRSYMAAQTNFDCEKLFARSCPHLSSAELRAYSAPFPSNEYLVGVQRFPALVPEFEDSEGAAISRTANTFWSEQWSGQSFMAIGAADPVLGLPVMHALRKKIRGCPEPLVIEDGGHFLQEWETGNGKLGESIIATALASFASCRT